MRVVVTGATGFVGSHAIAALREAGHEPIALVRNLDKARKILDGVEVCQADVRDARAVREGLERGEAVLHAAAEIGVIGAGQDLAGTNVTGLRNVLGQAVELGLDPIVHVSTIAVFVPPKTPLITSESPLGNPRNDYGKTKIAGERYARELQAQGAPVTIFYPGGVCGPDQPTLDALNEGLVSGIRQGWPMTRGGVGLLDVRDLALMLANAMKPGAGARKYMIGGYFLTWAQLADLCEEVTGKRCRRYPAPVPVLRGMAALLDLVKKVAPIRYPLTRDAAEMMVSMVRTYDEVEDLGVRLRPARETMADTVAWLKAEGHL
ncbi:NAD-dependent epimerase/dehydratase family protein [Streptosporangiaceae bacterium NEAU-GS5]|nr:NAD-dependent epimerase/dehydratase family protein [Streptosporangiaceae bacterium NEAU-GS5]